MSGYKRLAIRSCLRVYISGASSILSGHRVADWMGLPFDTYICVPVGRNLPKGDKYLVAHVDDFSDADIRLIKEAVGLMTKGELLCLISFVRNVNQFLSEISVLTRNVEKKSSQLESLQRKNWTLMNSKKTSNVMDVLDGVELVGNSKAKYLGKKKRG